MKYLNRKETAYHAEVGDEVMFISDFNEVAVGSQGVVIEKGEEHVVVRLAPKTTYEQENASLRASVTVTDEDMNVLAFSGDLQEYEPKPEPEAPAEVKTNEEEAEKKDGDDDTNKGADTTPGAELPAQGTATAPEGSANLQGPAPEKE